MFMKDIKPFVSLPDHARAGTVMVSFRLSIKNIQQEIKNPITHSGVI
jgi:hypothetical protein